MVTILTFLALDTCDAKTCFFFFFLSFSVILFFTLSLFFCFFLPSPFCLDKNMQLEMARHHHHQRQPQSSNANPNHYVNLSIPYPVSLNYHLSDLNNNDMGTEATDIIDFTGSDSASHSSCSVPSSAASSSVHLPLDDISARRRESLLAYDNVRF